MRRRRFLRATAIGTGLLAGCVSDGPGAGSEPTTEEDTEPTTTHPPLTRTETEPGATTWVGTTDEPLTRTESADTPTTQPGAEETATRTQSAGETTATRTDGRGTRRTERTPIMAENTNKTTESRGDIQRRMRLASVDDVPDEHELTIEVELVESTVTAAHAVHLRITATDETSRKRRLTIGTDGCDLFNRGKGKSDPAGLWLHDPSSTDTIDRAGECWTADQNPDDPRAFADYGCGYPPAIHDEPIVNEYLVWDDYQVKGYMEPGTYRFAVSIAVGGGAPDTTTTTESEATFTWGFDLAVENPE